MVSFLNSLANCNNYQVDMNKNFVVYCFLGAGLLLFSQISTAQTPKFVNEFLNIGVGARSHGMGGAMVAHANDNTAAYWNTAGLSFNSAPFQVSAMHAEWFGGIVNYDYLAVGKSLDADQNAYGSISIIRLAVDQIPNTLRLYGPDGSIDYSRIENFSVGDYAGLISYARRLSNERFAIGGNVKIIHRSAGRFANAWGFGLDLGVTYRTDNWMFGLMARDVTTTYNSWTFSFTEEEKAVLQSTNNAVPESSTEIALPHFIAGLAYQTNLGEDFSLLIACDFHVTTDGKRNTLVNSNTLSMDPRIGFEAGFKDLVFLRGGVYNFQRALDDINSESEIWTVQPNFGIGLHLGNFRIDYALGNLGQVSQVEVSHLFSVSVDIHPRG